MRATKIQGLVLTFLSFLISFSALSQTSYTLAAAHKDEDCSKGNASVDVQGIPADSVKITWSTGSSLTSIKDLDAGNYSANISIRNGALKLDTTIQFQIEKTVCKVVISNHFTPNGDAYNDYWSIGNLEHYPKFELYVFNKWGQQVFSQKGSYTPWDGKWNGINVPDGTYYYVFYYEPGKSKDLEKGDVSILR